MNKNVKPFIKWAGGKTQLLEEIRKKYPENIKSYCEPFVGGGAVLLDILSTFSPSEVMINDVNAELINTYRQIQVNVDTLINELKKLQDIFWESDKERRKLIFNEKRNRFNELKINSNVNSEIEQAALFIFLNKTCFNGLYRVNRKGLFNVPIGSYKQPIICDEENLRSISGLLEKVVINCGDYSECYDFIHKSTFVYLDPPYRPLTETASFTSYTENEFGDCEQIKLRRFVDKICDKGAIIVVSNSDPKNINKNDEFFDNLYEKYIIERVVAKRMINSNGNKRGDINELLIFNY